MDSKSSRMLCGLNAVKRAIGRTCGATLLLLAAPALVYASNCSNTSVGITPLNDLGAGSYLGFQGGLYPGGANLRPTAHEADGISLGRSIVPLDSNGNPSPGGKYVMVSIGMSNTTQEFSRFLTAANSDSQKDPNLVIVDGAQNGQTADIIRNANAGFWSTLNGRLSSAGVNNKQVAVAWVKVANRATTGTTSYRNGLRDDMKTIARVLKSKFPNIKLAYYSSRIYAGYSDSTLNPEPYAFESGLSVKWAVEAQLNGDASLNYDAAQGTVNAPWLSWGPYMWADGLTPRSDGLTWKCSELASDGTHPSTSGQRKVGDMLLDFVKADTTAREWFVAGDTVAPSAPQNLTVEQ